MNRGILIFVLLLATTALPVAATNSDTDKEARWADQVIDGLLDGDEVWLVDDTGHEFLGIFTEAETESNLAVVLLHGIGVHPNWPDVIYPLREGLLERGVTTLSLQMPILENDASLADYAPLLVEVPGRINAALKFLNDAGYSDITLVGHSLGSSMAMYYLASGGSPVSSLVVIGMRAGVAENENLEALAAVKIPVLDLYGSEDLEPVLDSVEFRREAGASGPGALYRQTRVEGSGHFFQGYEEALLEQVYGWIETRQQ